MIGQIKRLGTGGGRMKEVQMTRYITSKRDGRTTFGRPTFGFEPLESHQLSISNDLPVYCVAADRQSVCSEHDPKAPGVELFHRSPEGVRQPSRKLLDCVKVSKSRFVFKAVHVGLKNTEYSLDLAL
jgi:hypothetical protein